MIESRTKKTFNNNKSLPFIFHPTVSVPPLAAARAGGQESRSLSRARRFTCSVPATPRKRQPCRVASAARLPPIGGGGGTPVGVRAAQRQRPLWKLRRGDVAGRRTAPPHHYLLLLLLPKSHQLLLLSPTIALSLYKSHPAWPFRPRRLHQIQARFSRAAARRLVHISPPRLSLLLDFTDLPCFTVPSSRGSGSCPLPASTAHAMHMADLLPQIGIAADMPLLPR